MAVFRVLCWALIFILRLWLPPGAELSLTGDCAKILKHSRLKRNVMTAWLSSYLLFLTFLTDSEVLLSAPLPQFSLHYDGTSILRPPKVLLRMVVRYRQHHCWMCNLSCIPFDLNNDCPRIFSTIILPVSSPSHAKAKPNINFENPDEDEYFEKQDISYF